MCNSEIIFAAGIGQQMMVENAKQVAREAAKENAAANINISQYQEDTEMTNVAMHTDENMQKITAAAGQASVVSAGAGVDIPVQHQVWAAATTELYGQAARERKRIASEGNLREAAIDMNLKQLLDKYAPASPVEWGLVLANSFAQGVAYERKIHGTDYTGEFFGMKLPEWVGGNRPKEEEEDDTTKLGSHGMPQSWSA
jgi:hypothetical protein